MCAERPCNVPSLQVGVGYRLCELPEALAVTVKVALRSLLGVLVVVRDRFRVLDKRNVVVGPEPPEARRCPPSVHGAHGSDDITRVCADRIPEYVDQVGRGSDLSSHHSCCEDHMVAEKFLHQDPLLNKALRAGTLCPAPLGLALQGSSHPGSVPQAAVGAVISLRCRDGDDRND